MQILEAVWSFLVSAGITGSVTALFIRGIATRAEREAERRRELLYKKELLRLEGEDCLASLILAVAAYSRGDSIDEKELLGHEKRYREYLTKSRAFGAELYADGKSRLEIKK